jgi:hypothetical protein
MKERRPLAEGRGGLVAIVNRMGGVFLNFSRRGGSYGGRLVAGTSAAIVRPEDRYYQLIDLTPMPYEKIFTVKLSWRRNSLRHPLRSRVEEGRGGVEAWPMAPFPFPAHQTGRADFPHPAFRRSSRQAHERTPSRRQWRILNTPSLPKTAFMVNGPMLREGILWRLTRKLRTRS